MKEVRIMQMDLGDGTKHYVSLWSNGKVIPDGSGYVFSIDDHETMGIFIANYLSGCL